ncbi:unnamed protein product [Cylindrotheca closterium]|uniref:Uncharacterized protein n=1 Tax=Cylindrotheca closterium TaxID=2856 RepID=A0AAD2JH84_9STRA|nr:unnamed protein product [Cylindrotheca closterium]
MRRSKRLKTRQQHSISKCEDDLPDITPARSSMIEILAKPLLLGNGTAAQHADEDAYYDDDEEEEKDDDETVSINEEQSDEEHESVTESAIVPSGYHISNFGMDIIAVTQKTNPRPLLADFESSNKMSSFDALIYNLILLNNTLSEPYWYQVFYRATEESKVYDGVGTFHELLELDQKQCLDVLVASGLVAPNKNHRMQAKRKIFERILDLVPGFDFKINTTNQGFSHTFVLIGPPTKTVPSLSEQIGLDKETPVFKQLI